MKGKEMKHPKGSEKAPKPMPMEKAKDHMMPKEHKKMFPARGK